MHVCASSAFSTNAIESLIPAKVLTTDESNATQADGFRKAFGLLSTLNSRELKVDR